MTDMLAPDCARDVHVLAEQIRFTQLHEIGQMAGWLQLVDAPPSSPEPVAMAGMASAEDLRRLQRARGRTNEILFLQLMIRHHQSGIDMAGHAVRHSTTDVVQRAAALVVDEQTQEMQVMATLLTQRDSAPLPFP